MYRRFIQASSLGLLAGLWPSSAWANPAVFISEEVGFDNAASRSQTDRLDDSWRTEAMQAGAIAFEQSQIPNGPNNEAIAPSRYPLLTTASGVTVEISLQDVTVADVINSDSTGTVASGSPRLSSSSTLQGDAPRPASFYDNSSQPRFWSESTGSSISRNAVLFDFSEPVTAFGAWFGDVETRTDGNGLPAVVRLLDANGDRIGADIVVATSTSDQSQCGSSSLRFPDSSDSFRGCGNRTTRWIGFVDPEAQVKQMLVIVGDDDFGDTGDREHLSIIGATLATKPGSPNLLLVKRITAINDRRYSDLIDGHSDVASTADDYVPAPEDEADNASGWPSGYLRGRIRGLQAAPGDVVEYTIYFLSNGAVAADQVLLCDYIPADTRFVRVAFNFASEPVANGLSGADRGIVLSQEDATVSLTNSADGDRGYYFAPGVDPANTFVKIDCEGDGNAVNRNSNGAIVVDVGNLPSARVSNNSSSAYGFVRFRVQVR
ncbi:MAG: DUF11 domain-containing protein [Leptolyngbyaceae cyanobacterium SM1_1_3]|nr:DUF11 domain-containing protein [Leptolyngbyaceae cyanobacterium SM1_1_3]NJN04171.1 DUF11 domain-containing protein [Leptolyngbyaceae cyanobacterium RM1_1_2]NJO08622.1 DUF11 domain-containing protein [Leptolyngbyaceae cyanobacterium SL_1_1]